MKELFLKFIEDKDIFTWILNIFLIGLSSLGIVYLFGKMLNIIKTHKEKNTIAFISFIINSISFLYVEQFGNKITKFIWNAWLLISILNVLYVWILWRSADRADNFLDKKGFKDKLKYVMRKRKRKL